MSWISIGLGAVTVGVTIFAFWNTLREYKRREEAHMQRIRDLMKWTGK